jgi:hypothetical protein
MRIRGLGGENALFWHIRTVHVSTGSLHSKHKGNLETFSGFGNGAGSLERSCVRWGCLAVWGFAVGAANAPEWKKK